MVEQVIVFCSNYRRELESLNLPGKYGDIEVVYFPSRCGMPPIEWAKLQESLSDVGSYKELHVVSCGGITGLSEKECINNRYYSHNFQQCYHLIINPDLAEHYIQKGFYLVTPGWLANWRNILGGWGFEQQDSAIMFFKDTARSILLLDTGVDPLAKANLAEFANYVERPYESIKVGLDYLKLLLNNTVLKSRVENMQSIKTVELADRQKELADFNIALDLLGTLTRVREEGSVIQNIKDMFTMLFAPSEVVFRSVFENNTAGSPEISKGDSFTLEVHGSSGLVGYLDIIGVNQPQYLDQYKKLSDKIVNICGLAIENARHYQVIKDLSDTDGLTGIANRRKLEHHLAHEWSRMRREKKPLALMMCDIDYFKKYNDLYGHQAGDDCLKKVAAALAGYCRRSGDLIARYGGEEFTLVLPAADREGANKLAEQIRKDIEALELKHEGSPVSDHVTLSIGVSCMIPTAGDAVENLIVAADKALYTAKEKGRNCAAMF